MINQSPINSWHEIGWNGLFLTLPASWQPTVIYPDYLFFEQEGKPVLEIKWQQIQGRFSVEKILRQIKGTLKKQIQLEEWAIPQDFQHLLASHTFSGFQFQHGDNRRHGLVLFCPECRRTALLQWYIDPTAEKKTLTRILESFQDHTEGAEQLWSMYDVQAYIPTEATLLSHEFLPGRYTLSFDFKGTTITIYRFKPAKVLLNGKDIGEFGKSLLNRPPTSEGNDWASWLYRAEGLELFLTKARRNPPWQWMRLWQQPEHNVILGVKAEGKRLTETGWLEKICENYTSLPSQ